MDQFHFPSDESEIYRHIVESARDYAIFAMDRDGTVLTWNAGSENLFGYTAGEIIGQNSAVIFSFEDQLDGVLLKEIRLALATGRAGDNRWHIRKDGSSFWASGLMMPLRNDTGEVYGLMKIVRDRTLRLHEDEALRASEERLQLILKSAIDYAIFAIDSEGRIISWNTGACRIFGYEEGEILGRDARILFVAEDRNGGALEREMNAAAEHGRAENDRFHLRKDGSTFWGSGLTMPLRAQRAGYLKVLRDDTERHFAEEHQQIMLREMSHRVKNSLALVAAMLAMQARSAKQEEVAQALRDAEARVGTIAEVHDQLWRQPQIETVDLADFLSSLCHRLQQSTTRHMMSVDADPCMVDADRAIQVALLVNELVTNSVKHAYPDGTGTVTVSARSLGEEIVLEVADCGKGLPLEVLSPENGGKSLGMKIVRALVQQLKAELHMENRQPGTGFVIRFPREA
ncbi:PAS domain S-box protein [Rhizobium bangladeshense]|uniref:Blue-light-activated histidine kinase n=1 Tax=Rhizobium bangladeshense TaxID=1138189 RepID=A0ABS7LIG6_9HYPH|nr:MULTISPECIES: PAS domain S-box protein [Rhizobium]MBX4871551.1 PAS domain S-box protein [Rhizobium bangladeshense]MBX4882865.1 PAS domain S-box protein [Rhizobium bangladeshense]MBX4920565.1 PAS domain S-box protein [Rhizobium bangladeshense]MBX4934245.1 PAS domain S-box protein [Rhizobium bangladeshense]MBY3582863.1 PAS domain S-box protein [Rhizobium bangladeshense]